MPARPVGVAVLALALAACSGSPTGTSGSGPTGAGGGATAALPTAASGTAATVDLASVKVCDLVPVSVIESLTGETGFKATQSASVSGAKCFWAVPKAGVPQFVEVRVSRRKSLDGYSMNVNGVACPAAALPGAEFGAVGGACLTPAKKVFLAAISQGVAVEVEVNEPKGTLTPDALASVAKAVFDGLSL